MSLTARLSCPAKLARLKDLNGEIGKPASRNA